MSSSISFRPDDQIRSLLDAFATKKSVTKTKVINDALLAYLKSTDEKIARQVAILRRTDSADDYLSDGL